MSQQSMKEKKNYSNVKFVRLAFVAFVMLALDRSALWINMLQQSMKKRNNSNVTFVMLALDKSAI